VRTEGRRDFIRQWRPSRGASLQTKQVAADPKSHGHQEHCGGGRISVSDARGGCRCGEPRAVFRPGRLGTLLTGVLVERLGLDRLLRCRPRSPRQRSSTDDCCSWQPSATKHCAPKGGQPARHLPPGGAAIGAPIGGLTRWVEWADLTDLISNLNLRSQIAACLFWRGREYCGWACCQWNSREPRWGPPWTKGASPP
jgi:hypothetical protein